MPAQLVVAFDIIETCFSLETMRVRLVSLGLPHTALEPWFAAGLRDAFALAVTGSYAPFRSVLENSLKGLTEAANLSVSDAAISGVLEGMTALEPHADMKPAFQALHDAKTRIIALSNGAAAATEALLQGAGVLGMVEKIISVEEIGLSKPRAEVYRHAASQCGVPPEAMMLVAAHPWDVHGAKVAGLRAAYVARKQPYPAFMVAPDIVFPTLAGVAQAIIRRSVPKRQEPAHD